MKKLISSYSPPLEINLFLYGPRTLTATEKVQEVTLKFTEALEDLGKLLVIFRGKG